MDTNFFTDAINLTIFGMGFVFLFLALMVIITNLMSHAILRIQPSINSSSSSDSDNIIKIDKKTRTIIEAAIKLHVKR